MKIKYVGKRLTHRDTIYGTGMSFSPGDAVEVSDALGMRMLRHVDVYARADDDAEAVKVAHVDKVINKNDENIIDVIDSISIMDKEALSNFAKTEFNMDLDKRKSIEKLRQDVSIKVNQFGVS